MKHLTPAQHRALLWLPADGKWTKGDRSVSAAARSLQRAYPDLVEDRTGPHGLRGGHCIQYRLTEAGITERRVREATP